MFLPRWLVNERAEVLCKECNLPEQNIAAGARTPQEAFSLVVTVLDVPRGM